MKKFTLLARLVVAFSVILLAGAPALGQVPTASSGTGINSAFVKLIGSVGPFTAKVETRVLDRSQNQLVRMPMGFAFLDGKVRLDIDLSQAQSKEFTASTLAKLKQSGMDHFTSIFRPDKKLTYLVYPGVQSYQELVQSKVETEAAEKGLKVEKSPLGKDTLDGQPCTKNRAVVKGAKGTLLDAVTWNATGLQDFPIQVEMKQDDKTVRMHFTDLRFVKPEAKQFEVPPGYGRIE
jgi:hypothetical protein